MLRKSYTVACRKELTHWRIAPSIRVVGRSNETGLWEVPGNGLVPSKWKRKQTTKVANCRKHEWRYGLIRQRIDTVKADRLRILCG